MKINVTQSSMPGYEEYCQEIKELWDSKWLTNSGVKHWQLENELKKYLDIENVVLYTNGHLALENVLEAMSFPRGSEVITTPFTFVSTTHAIIRSGLKPIFCDINEIDYTLDVSKLESLITDNTVAILPVHVYGNICNVSAIDKIAKKYNLKVIYDGAHAFGVEYNNQSISVLGDATMFSFHATKVFNTIEGGAVCFKEKELTKHLNNMKNFGIEGPENIKVIGGNAKMNEFQAAMGICNLRHIDTEIKKRRIIVEQYIKRLSNIPGITLCSKQENVTSNYAYFPVVFENYIYSRDEIYEKLMQCGIMARKYFYPLTNELECYAGMDGFNSKDTPVANNIANRILTLPLYADLSIYEVDYICDTILKQGDKP